MWTLLAIMMSVNTMGDQDVYMFKHSFKSGEQCAMFYQANHLSLVNHLIAEFPAQQIETVLCVEEDTLKDLLKGPLELHPEDSKESDTPPKKNIPWSKNRITT